MSVVDVAISLQLVLRDVPVVEADAQVGGDQPDTAGVVLADAMLQWLDLRPFLVHRDRPTLS